MSLKFLRGRQAGWKQARQRSSSRRPLEKMKIKRALIDNKLSIEEIVAAQSQFYGKKERSSFIEQDRKYK